MKTKQMRKTTLPTTASLPGADWGASVSTRDGAAGLRDAATLERAVIFQLNGTVWARISYDGISRAMLERAGLQPVYLEVVEVAVRRNQEHGHWELARTVGEAAGFGEVLERRLEEARATARALLAAREGMSQEDFYLALGRSLRRVARLGRALRTFRGEED